MISASPHEAFRAYSNDTAESAYTPDYAAEIDGEGDELAEDFFWFVQKQIPASKMKVDWLVMREVIACARVIGLLLSAKNLAAQVHALAFAAGLDQLNGKRSQAEIARELGCTRALISHYVVGWADVLGLSITKFRKSEGSRATYKAAQLNRKH